MLITLPVNLIKDILGSVETQKLRGSLGPDYVCFVLFTLNNSRVVFFFLTLKLEDSEEPS